MLEEDILDIFASLDGTASECSICVLSNFCLQLTIKKKIALLDYILQTIDSKNIIHLFLYYDKQT